MGPESRPSSSRFPYALLGAAPLAAQMERVPDRPAGEGEGPYDTLIITGATMIEGSGAPPMGPVDIVVRGNRIASIHNGRAPDSIRAEADRIVDANGMTVMPGFVDTHGHNGDARKAPQPSYGYKLWLAHGVTSVRGVSFYWGPDQPDLADAHRSATNRITAPRLYPYAAVRRQMGRRRGRYRSQARAAGYAGRRRRAIGASSSSTGRSRTSSPRRSTRRRSTASARSLTSPSPACSASMRGWEQSLASTASRISTAISRACSMTMRCPAIRQATITMTSSPASPGSRGLRTRSSSRVARRGTSISTTWSKAASRSARHSTSTPPAETSWRRAPAIGMHATPCPA